MAPRKHKLSVNKARGQIGGTRYYSKGHHEPREFLDALNESVAARGKVLLVQFTEDDVKCGDMYITKARDTLGAMITTYKACTPDAKGAFPATYVELKLNKE
jgi:hypothetical protein